VFIGGPTASGKSAVAIALAAGLPGGGEIVNADAFQLYAGLRIVTARPSAEEEEQCPHHLYGWLDPRESCNAQRFRETALPVIGAISKRGAVPIVVGGSGLYLKALTHGLPDVPPADPVLREKLANLPLEERVAQLEKLDPKGAAAMDLQNDRYVSRALEISILAGRPGSELKAEWLDQQPSVDAFWLDWDRDDLCNRIAERSRAMLRGGALKEVADLADLSATAEKAIGIGEIRRHLGGETSLEQCVEELTIATRQYAKRQRTWFRRETCFQRIEVVPGQAAAEIAAQIVELLGRDSADATPEGLR